ncbi:MAG: hypothetical protein LBR40_04145 [Bacilli bacterium]|nr:hypothetical protein [Bacilli bacterium]
MGIRVERFCININCKHCTNLAGIYEAESWEDFNSKYNGRNNPFGRYSFCDCSIRSYYTYDNNKVLLDYYNQYALLIINVLDSFTYTYDKEYFLNMINAIYYSKKNKAKYYDILNHYSIRAKLFKVNDTGKIVNNTIKAFETKELNVLKQLNKRFGGLFSKVQETVNTTTGFRPDAIWINERLFKDKIARFIEIKESIGSFKSIKRQVQKANQQLKSVNSKYINSKYNGIVFLKVVRDKNTINRTNKQIINDVINRARANDINNLILQIDNNELIWFQPQEYSKSIK